LPLLNLIFYVELLIQFKKFKILDEIIKYNLYYSLKHLLK
jgi:hypothetical protein